MIIKIISKISKFILLILLFSISPFVSISKDSSPNYNIPDFCQGNSRYGILPNGGKPYCGPTAISNILVYLDKNGFPNLIEKENPTSQDQFNLIKLLGARYTKTSLESGTEPINLMKGLEKYVKEKGYDISIQWKGWTNGGKYSIGRIPEQEWINKVIGKFSYAILQVGWYKYDPKNEFYERIGGHYVTGVDIKNNGIIIHDPSLRSGIESKDELCKFSQIKSGKLSGWEKYKERNATGYLKLEGIKVKECADIGIVDGAFIFKILP